jgi:NADPH-dependent curcumin reductase CurA
MEIGKPVISVSVIGRVLKSDTTKIKEGALVRIVLLGTETYSRIPKSQLDSVLVLDPQDGIPITAYLGALGMTGMKI